MNKRLIFIFIFLSTFVVLQAQAAPTSPARNKDGSIVTGVLTAGYDPLNGLYPFPFNLLFLGTTDLTLNPPVADPNDLSDPAVALSSLDGFSTTEKWTTRFLDNNRQPGSIDPTSVVPGQSVRVFQVTTSGIVAVTGIVRELTPGLEFTAVAAPGGVLAIIPLKPLPQYSSFMAVLTNDINDTAGNDATPDQTYHLTKRRTPWVDANGHSTYALIPDATARSLEPQRQITQSMEYAAASAGIDPDDIVLSWTVQTQSITPTLKLLRSIAQPADTIIAPTGLSTANIGLRGLANIYIGVITLPYYSGIPSAANPVAMMTGHWKAEPGAYVPPFDQFGLDPTSTNITIANPFPVLTGMQTVPLLVTVPNANSGLSKPAGGWPVVIYQHGLTRQRTDALAIVDTLASIGYAVVSMDQPLHGVVPDVQPELAPFYIENTPFGPIANERTFDADLVNNATGAPGPDGLIDPSGNASFNLLNLQAARDNLRQAEADISVLALSIQNMDIDGDTVPDFNGLNVALVSQSLGAYVSGVAAAVEPVISRAFLSAGGGGMIRSVEGGAFGGRMRAALAAAGIQPGTADYEAFLIAAQTMLDPADSINWGAEAAARIPILSHLVVGDLNVPNYIPGAPLAGGEAQIRIMGQAGFSSTQVNPEGLRAAGRFLPPAAHESLLDPTPSLAATVEMQGQMASFIASAGTFIQVANPDLMVPVVEVELAPAKDVNVQGGGKAGKGKNGVKPVNSVEEPRGNDNE